MPLWGALDNATGNQKPIFANSNNKNMMANTVYGVSATERANATGALLGLAHAGWNIIKKGTGPVRSITITNAGAGINANGFLIVTTPILIGGGTINLNVSYTMANSLNSQQNFSTNSTLNVISSVSIVNPGIGYNVAPTVVISGSNTVAPTFTITMGGRVGRITSETLVAGGSITGDDSADDFILPGT